MELVSRVRALLRRTKQTEGPRQLSYSGILLDDEKHAVYIGPDKIPIELTYKEFELLKYLMNNRGYVLSLDKIMDRVWGLSYEGGSRTVDMHIKTLRKKLGDAGACIQTVRNVGYRFE